MKKIRIIVAIIVTLVSLIACTSNKFNSNMQINQARLSHEKQGISNLSGDGLNCVNFNFSVDKTIQSIRFNIFKLKNSKWEIISGGECGLTDSDGKIALSFSNLEKGLRTDVEGENTHTSVAYTFFPTTQLTDMNGFVKLLSKDAEVEYEKEIPLVIQVFTAKQQTAPNSVEDFNHPEKYQKSGYDYVYAITVTFSQKEFK